MLQHWLARLSYVFFIFAAILGWDVYGALSGRGRPLPQWRIWVELALAIGCLIFGTAGVRARHQDVRDEDEEDDSKNAG